MPFTQEQLLQFVISNNTDAVIPNVPFFTQNPSFNAVTQYQWTLPSNLNDDYLVMTPTIVTLQQPALEVVVPLDIDTQFQPTYEAIVQSISTNNYSANFIYVQSLNCNQVGQVFTYYENDIAGNAVVSAMPFTLDPYQSQCAIYFYPPEDSVVFSGESALTFSVLPQTTMNLKMFASTKSDSLILDDSGELKTSTFVEVAENLGSDVFSDYCNYLIDNE